MTYKNRYTDQAKQYAYMNACDCLYYGYGRKYWNDCGLNTDEANAVWKQAYEDMTSEF